MRLDFNVLWIEDQPHNVSGFEESFRNKVEDEGFSLKIQWARSLDEAMPYLSEDVFRDNVDLVVVDYDLGLAAPGNIAVREVRRMVRFKDIVFYSAKQTGDLRKMMSDDGIEGVWCAYRPNLSDTLNSLFDSLVKKVLDIDHCRGIVMGVTSDIDHIVQDCLLQLEPHLTSECRELAENYISTILEEGLLHHTETRDVFAASKSISDLLAKHRVFTAIHKLGLLKRILESQYDNEHVRLRKAIGKYMNDVVPHRNTLGHRRLTANDGIRSLRSRGAKPVTAEELKAFRQLLIRYRDSFDELATALGVTLD
jgi:hypothetical protein